MKKNYFLYALKRHTPMLFSFKWFFEARPSSPKGLFALLCLALSANLAEAQPFDSNKLERLQNSILSTDGISAVYTEGKTLYTTSYSNGLYIFDISNPFAPNTIGRSTEISIPTAGILKKDNYLFVTDNVSGVIILDVSNPQEPKLVTKLKTASSEGWDLAIDKTGNTLFVATGKTGVEIWNISYPEKPVQKAKISGNFKWDYAWSLTYKNDRLYVSDRSNGVRIFDVSNPEAPKLLLTYATSAQNQYAIASDTLLFLANGASGFEIVDISDIDLPRRVFNQSIKSQVINRVALYEKNPDYIFVSAGRGGISVYHIPSILKDKPRKIDKTDNSVPVEFGQITQSGHAIYVAANRGVHIYNYDLAPFLTKAEDQTIDENALLNYTFEGIDPDGSPIAIGLTAIGPKPDSLVYNNAVRTVKWKPSYEESGTYSFNVQITEQTQDNLSTQQSFRIRVRHVNRAPSIAQLPPQLVQENNELVYQVPAGTDPDREDTDRLTYEALDLPRGALFDPLKRSFTWKPDFTQAGDYTARIIVHDSNSDKKGILSDTTTLSARVDNVNLAPRFIRLTLQTFKEDSAQSFIIKSIDPDREDSLGLTYTASLLPKGASFDAATQICTWKPDFEQAGNYTAKFLVNDQGLNAKFVATPAQALRDTMSVDVAVKQTNRKPKLAPIAAAQIKESTLLTFSISGTDPDKEDAGKLVFSAERLPEGATFNPETKTFSWTPTFDQSGLYSVLFKVTDSAIDGIALSDTQSVAITIINVNRAPMLARPAALNSKEDTPLTFEVQVSDRDKEDIGKLKVVANDLPEGSKFEGVTLSWIPGYTQAGSYKIRYTVTDLEGLSDSATQSVTITDKNRAPKFKQASAQRGTENTTLMFPVSASDLDEQDAGKLRYSALNPPEGASFDATTQVFSWNPNFTQAGEYKLLFKVNDTGMDGNVMSDSLTVPVTIANVNRPPEIIPVRDTTLAEGATLSVGLRISDPDKEDAGKLKASASPLPNGATLNGQQLTWKPDYDQAGTYTVTYMVKDAEGLSAITVQNVTVLNTNRPPVLSLAQTVNGVESGEIKFKVQANDPDKEDARNIRVTWSELPQGAKIENGEFSWKPTFEQAGSHTITYKVEDAGGLSDTKTQTITVANKNRAPKLTVGSGVSVKAIATETVSISLSASDEDSEDAGNLGFSADNLPQGANLDSRSGSFTWTPTAEQTGTEKITFKVTDKSGATDTKTVTIAVSKPPVTSSETGK